MSFFALGNKLTESIPEKPNPLLSIEYEVVKFLIPLISHFLPVNLLKSVLKREENQHILNVVKLSHPTGLQYVY